MPTGGRGPSRGDHAPHRLPKRRKLFAVRKALPPLQSLHPQLGHVHPSKLRDPVEEVPGGHKKHTGIGLFPCGMEGTLPPRYAVGKREVVRPCDAQRPPDLCPVLLRILHLRIPIRAEDHKLERFIWCLLFSPHLGPPAAPYPKKKRGAPGCPNAPHLLNYLEISPPDRTAPHRPGCCRAPGSGR